MRTILALLVVAAITPSTLAAAAATAPATRPSSPLATTALSKFKDALAAADKTLTAARTAATTAYLADLQRVLDASLTAANVEEANWAKAEVTRIKSNAAEPGKPASTPAGQGARARYVRSMDQALDAFQRSAETARRACLADLAIAKRVAAAELKDLDEANRIVAEIESVKVAKLAPASGDAASTSTSGTKPAIIAAFSAVRQELRTALTEPKDHPEEPADADVLKRKRLGNFLRWSNNASRFAKMADELDKMHQDIERAKGLPDAELSRAVYNKLDEIYSSTERTRKHLADREASTQVDKTYARGFEALKLKVDVWSRQLQTAGLKDPRTQEVKERARGLRV